MRAQAKLPTALQVIAGHSLHGTNAIVTGGAAGIGAETVRALATAGARVTLTSRKPSQAEPIVATLRAATGNPAISVAQLDLSSLASVRAFVASFEHTPLHLLINNAGLCTRTLSRTSEGFEMHFGVNHLGHFALAVGLLPVLRAAGNARIVSVTSVAHQLHDINFDDPNFFQRPYEVWSAYGQSKTANALFAVGLMQHHAADGITANAVHPGGILTDAWHEFSREEMVAMRLIDPTGKPHGDFRSAEQGAATAVWAAISPGLEGIGGRYLEDCAVAGETPDTLPEGRRWPPGYRPHALDPDRASRLWSLSERLVA